MGRSAIEEKLNHELQLTITSERQVVYILAEIRKLLELENAQSQYPTLNFCCNWALHARLTTSAEARRIVEVFDWTERFHSLMDNTPGGEALQNPDWSWVTELGGILELRDFRGQFQAFCKEHHLRGKVLDDEVAWVRFLEHYAAVIEDVSLVSSDPSLAYVREVTTTRVVLPPEVNAAEAGKTYCLALEWEWMSPAGTPRVTKTMLRYTVVPEFAVQRQWIRIQALAARARLCVLRRRRA
jgi:hypothetical protein